MNATSNTELPNLTAKPELFSTRDWIDMDRARGVNPEIFEYLPGKRGLLMRENVDWDDLERLTDKNKLAAVMHELETE